MRQTGLSPKPLFTVTCDATNNGLAEELTGIVNADFRFEGVKKVYRIEFLPTEGTSYSQLRRNLFTRLKELLSQVPEREVADGIMKLVVDSEWTYGRKRG